MFIEEFITECREKTIEELFPQLEEEKKKEDEKKEDKKKHKKEEKVEAQ